MKRAFQILVFCFLVFTLSACSFMKEDKPKVEEEKEIVYHKVSFFDDSGVLIKENSVIHETSLIFDGNTPSKSSTAGVEFEFIGWDYTGDKLVDELPSSVTSPMQLKAVFDYKIDGQSVDFHRGSINQPTFTIESKTDMYVIDFSKLSGKQMLNTTVNIPQQLNRLVVIGNRDKDRSQFFEHITFNIMSRTTNIDLVFSDFAFSANSFNSGVVNSSNIELTIDFIGGQNEIYGSKGLDGQNGFYAISSTKLTIEGLAASLYGGEGGDGIAVTSNEHGKKGGDGGFAINATELTLNASSLMLRSGNGGKGSDGSSGNDAKDHTENAGNGFNGGAGGSGGTVINATTIVNNTPNLTLVVGSGGNGGAGGTGGSGAKGPDGIMVLKKEVTESNQAQNGSNGGQGGNGGTGGELGMFMNGNISGLTNIVKTAGIRGNGGAGGHGGIGGNGGNGAPDKGTYFVEKPYNLNGANGGAGGAGGSGGSGYVGGTKGLGAEGGAAGMGTSKTFGVFGNYKDQGSNGNPGAKGIDGYDGNSQG